MAKKQSDLHPLQQSLGYNFKDETLLERSLRHASLSTENDSRSLERLEFLGDRVLGLFTAEELWRRYPHFSEGDMAPRLNAMVRKETCADAARFFGLGPYIRLAPSEAEAGGREKTSVLGDVCEALLGALYIDGGLEAARKIYNRYWIPNFEDLAKKHRDAKTELQQWAQKQGLPVPEYKIENREGPAHAPLFTLSVHVKGVKAATAQGTSKLQAQSAAAEHILRREGVWEDTESDD